MRYGGPVERCFTVAFGPSRSKRFGKAVAEARRGANGWCASAQLGSFGACRFRFFYGVFPRCSLCPLFDAERAIRDVLGENGPPPGPVIEITLGPTLRALLRGEVPAALVEESEPSCELPDFPPEGWRERRGDERPS